MRARVRVTDRVRVRLLKWPKGSLRVRVRVGATRRSLEAPEDGCGMHAAAPSLAASRLRATNPKPEPMHAAAPSLSLSLCMLRHHP